MTLQFIVVIFLAFCCMFVITGVIVGAIESLIKAIKTRRSAKNFIKIYNKMMARSGHSPMTKSEEKQVYINYKKLRKSLSDLSQAARKATRSIRKATRSIENNILNRDEN